MGFLDQVRGWLRTEAKEAKDAVGDLERRLDQDLSERERRLDETPEERLDRLQREIDESGSLDTVRDRIEGRSFGADAADEVNRIDQPDDDPDELDRP